MAIWKLRSWPASIIFSAPLGGKIVGDVYLLGLVSTVSSMMWIGPRVTRRWARTSGSPPVLHAGRSSGVPAIAILFQLLVADLLLLTQSFEAVLDFVQFSLTFCSFFTVWG